MAEKISNFLKGQIVTSILYIVLGCCLAFMPVATINVICKFVFGILLILVGVYHIITYVVEKMSATILDLFCGGVLLVLGIFLFSNPQIVIKLLPILLGTFIVVDSVWVLKGAIRLQRRSYGPWKFLLLGSLIFIGLGIALIVNPFAMVKYTVMFAGWVFLCNGIVDLVFLILLHKGLKEVVQDLTAVDAEGKIVDGENAAEAAEAAPVEEKPAEDIIPKPEYTAWSDRNQENEETAETSETDATAEADTTAEAETNPEQESEAQPAANKNTETSVQESVEVEENKNED